MKQLVLNISDSKFDAFLSFIKTLSYVKVEKEDHFLSELQTSLNQVKLMKDGKLEKQTVNDFLDEF